MSGEPQPGERGDKLDRGLFTLKAVWFGLFSGALVLTIAMAAIVVSKDGVPLADLGELGYLFLLAVPGGLIGAYLIVPALTAKEPGVLVRSAGGRAATMYEGWNGTPAEEPYYWFPVYASQLIPRAAMLEGSAILCAVGFLITANWAVLGGALVMIAALVAAVPTRSAVESFAESMRGRGTGG